MASGLGDLIVIYYSQRRVGFSPPLAVDVTALPEDDHESTECLKNFVLKGRPAPHGRSQQAKLKRDHPVLAGAFSTDLSLDERNPKWPIYSINPDAPRN